MVRAGKQRIVTQQFTMQTFTSQLDFKGRNRFRSMRMQGRSISDHRMVSVAVHRPRRSSRRKQDHPKAGK
jgi:hypothetical protein